MNFEPFGKTSLVFKAIEQLEKAGFICVYFDFMPVFSPESFVRLYSKALSERQSNLNKFAQMFESFNNHGSHNMLNVFVKATSGTSRVAATADHISIPLYSSLSTIPFQLE